MATRRPTKALPRTRDRSATEERILAAVGKVLARDGFGAVGVNAIAREAGFDKVPIYRYDSGLPERLQAWGGGFAWTLPMAAKRRSLRTKLRVRCSLRHLNAAAHRRRATTRHAGKAPPPQGL